MVALVSREDVICARAQARLAAEFVGAGSPFRRDTNVSQCDLPTRDPAEDEPWRRVTGMTVVQEPKMDRKERRAGIAKLFAEIEREYVRATLKTEFGEPFFSATFRAQAGIAGAGGVEVGGGAAGLDDLSDIEGTARGAGRPHYDSFWACEGSGRTVLGAVCQDYNISVAKLNALAREYKGITALELIDGLRVQPVRPALGELLKTHALSLWYAPGVYINVLINDQRLRVSSFPSGPGGASKFFVDPDAMWRRKELYELREERALALLAAFDAGWKQGAVSKDGFAVGLGFRSFKELNRACLNVYGKTVRQVAFAIVKEIVEFYLAAEVKALRELAARDFESTGVMRARYLYRKNCERPEGPYCDFWEAQDPAWLRAMGGWLGS